MKEIELQTVEAPDGNSNIEQADTEGQISEDNKVEGSYTVQWPGQIAREGRRARPLGKSDQGELEPRRTERVARARCTRRSSP